MAEADGLDVLGQEFLERLYRQVAVLGYVRGGRAQSSSFVLKGVPDDHELHGGGVQADAAGGGPWGVDDPDLRVERQAVAVFEEVVHV